MQNLYLLTYNHKQPLFPNGIQIQNLHQISEMGKRWVTNLRGIKERRYTSENIYMLQYDTPKIN